MSWIMLLGTLHFADPGLDEHKPRHGFDALSARRQGEIAEVVERLASYAPTKLAVERTRDEQAEVDRAYIGEAGLGPDEVEQLGFRLAFRNLQRITEGEDERLLLVIGAGHLPVLRHCAQASPEYEVVEVAEYLGDG